MGDICILETGNKVSADGIVLVSHNMSVDESPLTGESVPLNKGRFEDGEDFIVKSGTQVVEGDGLYLVLAVGENSEWGRLLKDLQVDQDKTPLQVKLESVVIVLSKIGLVAAIIVFCELMIRWGVDMSRLPDKSLIKDYAKDDGPVKYFATAVALIAVVVPEGLPLAVMIALAYSMRKMMKDMNFVRVLAACETMGGATTICSDKTGTLTENRMTVVEGFFQGRKFDYQPRREELDPQFFTQLVNNICLNSKASVLLDKKGKLQFVGNRTECALIMMAQ